MSELEKYTSYKDSGIEWLGDIPEHWETKKMKYLGKMFAGLTDKKGDDFSKEITDDKKPFIPFTNVCNNVKINSNQMQYVKVNPYEKQNKVQKNDIIFLMSSETFDDIGKCSIYLDEEQFYLNSFCKGFRPKVSNINPEFLNYSLQSKTYRNYFGLVGRGFTRINIKQEYITDLSVVLPNDEEQTKIVSFLDVKTAQIDKTISQREKLISLLKEQKQITINEAVTKGLDKDVEFKDSGVEWLGTMPKHWELVPLKYILKERNERSISGEETLFMMSQVYGLVVRADYHEKAEVAKDNIGNKKVYKNDLVFNKLKAHLGVFYKSNIETVGLVSPDYAVYYSNDKIEDLKFLEVLFRHPKYIGQFISLATGIVEGLIRLYTDDLFSLKVAVPPKEEQEQIITYIEYETATIDKAIELQKKYIVKLKEYKASLIDTVVTGKIKVA